MYYIFSTTPEEAIALFWANIADARQGGSGADWSFRRALVALVELDHLLGQTPPVLPSVYNQFRQESTEALLAFPAKLGAYSDIALYTAEDAREDSEWYELCMRRSVIQVLRDDYASTPVADLIRPDDVSNLDAELRRVGAEYGPLPPQWVPGGLPSHHWWWRYPISAAATDTTV